MEKYTLEEIYELVGKKDKTAHLTFIPGSEAYQNYGPSLTVVFVYTQYERQEMDEAVKTKPFSKSGYLKAIDLLTFDKKVEQELLKTGICSDDILDISYFAADPVNTYHSQDTRTIKKIEIDTKPHSGGDLEWMYGFNAKMVREGIGLSPKERESYLAQKYYFEPKELTEEELLEMKVVGDNIRPEIRFHFLQIKIVRDEALTDDEHLDAAQLIQARINAKKNVLDQYLKEAGSSYIKLGRHDISQLARLMNKVEKFKERRLNAVGKIPVYLDLGGYLHIYMRHVKELKFNGHFHHKDDFQWEESDVLLVMTEMILSIDGEVQEFFKKNPGIKYSRYGRESVYFEGDFYTIHIESSGRISTFYKNTKKLLMVAAQSKH
ncbi:hypothetical protein [Pedobacter antarcticus]|uniref:hypothetical protein n=1 Tax=Pedobacter antarcticus TaxID=34086 RepID=UPI0029307550|nr:hypothetical protein [Pedobacter antarcticus]